MEVVPSINTGAAAPQNYFEYLTSPEWRRRRNLALKRAGWKCAECPARRDLQVHHRTYERLGHELDTDLVVLCVACHEGKHPAEAAHEYVRHYLKLAREVMATGPHESLPDFTEALKMRCATTGLYYNTEKLARAIWLVWRERVHTVPIRPAADFIADTWFTAPSRSEARQILRNLKALDAAEHMKTMPPVDHLLTTQRELDARLALEIVAKEIRTSLARCAELERKPAADEGTE